MKTLIAWPEGKREEGMLEPKRKCKRDRNTSRGGEEGSAADIKFQPRRVTQTCPRPNQTRRVERVLVETRVADTDKDCRGTRWGAPQASLLPPAARDWV